MAAAPPPPISAGAAIGCGYGLVPIAELGRLAGVATPAIDALVYLASLAAGVDYAHEGLTLARLGLAGKSPAELASFVEEGWS
jgi:opine dehydrogenase